MLLCSPQCSFENWPLRNLQATGVRDWASFQTSFELEADSMYVYYGSCILHFKYVYLHLTIQLASLSPFQTDKTVYKERNM